MAVYFKIQMQYKRTHDGKIIEATGRNVARPFLELCLAAKQGPAPSRVLEDDSFSFTSTEFPLDHDCCIRLCEVTSPGGGFVRGIFMLLHGESAHLRTYTTLLADKACSRRRINILTRQLDALVKQSQSKEILGDYLKAIQILKEEETRYAALDDTFRCLKFGDPGISSISHKVSSPGTHPEINEGATLAKESSPDIFSLSAIAPLSLSMAPSKEYLRSKYTKFDEDEFFAVIFLSSKHAATVPRPAIDLIAPTQTSRIVKLFEDALLSRHPKEDCWEEKGSISFRRTLEFFLQRKVPIQFCLPAFPCKSTNPRKTSSTVPDGAEYEAFSNLHRFCNDLQSIYEPGVEFIVVSDGHVFSDCIGVNDRDVYEYTDAVKRLSEDIHQQVGRNNGQENAVEGLCCQPLAKFDASLLRKNVHSDADADLPGKSPITFLNLHDVFHGHGIPLDRVYNLDWTNNNIYRPIATKIDPRDEYCRRLMLRSCGFDAGMLEKAIKDNKDHSLTKVYRGFSRFMKDKSSDLDDHPDMKHQNPSKRSDLASAAAKEMLKRNQAYSHLVEILHPCAIRLSIHQHKNNGPKFAINTLHKDNFRLIQKMEDIYSWEDIDNAKDSKVEEAHIPTPWHNVLMEVEGHAMIYVCKNGIVEDEQQENPNSPYVCEWRDDGRGARWYLKKCV